MPRERFYNDVFENDLQIRVGNGSRVWLTEKTRNNTVSVSETVVDTDSDINTESVTLNGFDLQTKIHALSDTAGVTESNVRGIHIADTSISTDKIGGNIPTRLGGTDSNLHEENAILFVSPDGSAVGSDSNLVFAGTSLSVTGNILLGKEFLIEPFGGSVAFRHVSDGNASRAVPLSDLSGGSNAAVTGVSVVSMDTLTCEAVDLDGDIRRIAVKYCWEGEAAPTAEAVSASPHDWYEVDEGAAHTIYVGDEAGSEPYHRFFWDEAMTREMVRPSGTVPLRIGSSYRFEKSTNLGTFYVGTDAATAFTDFDVDSSHASDYNSGIRGGEFLQFSIPSGFSGSLSHYGSVSPARAFDLLPPTVSALDSPVHTVTAEFDTSQLYHSDAYFVVEDAKGNLSPVQGPVKRYRTYKIESAEFFTAPEITYDTAGRFYEYSGSGLTPVISGSVSTRSAFTFVVFAHGPTGSSSFTLSLASDSVGMSIIPVSSSVVFRLGAASDTNALPASPSDFQAFAVTYDGSVVSYNAIDGNGNVMASHRITTGLSYSSIGLSVPFDGDGRWQVRQAYLLDGVAAPDDVLASAVGAWPGTARAATTFSDFHL